MSGGTIEDADSKLARYDSTGKLDELDRATLVYRDLVERTIDGHPEKPDWLNKLANALLKRYERVGDLADLKSVMTALRRSIELTPVHSQDKPTRMGNLGMALQIRFERLGHLESINDAVCVMQLALALTRDGHPERSPLLDKSADCLQSRFKRLGRTSDIEDAVTNQRLAVELLSDDHPDKPSRLSNLSIVLQIRFERLGRVNDLREAMSIARLAVTLTPDTHPSKRAYLNNLGTSLINRYQRFKSPADIKEAVEIMRRVALLTPEDHPKFADSLHNLGSVLGSNFELSRNPAELEEAIASQRKAVSLTPPGHTNEVARLNHLAISLHKRFTLLGELSDLDEAISIENLIVRDMPDDHAQKAFRLRNLGNALRERYERLGTLPDLESAIAAQRRSVELAPEGHPEKPNLLCSLGNSLRDRFEHLGQLSDIEDAIQLQRSALDLVDDWISEKPSLLSNLGTSLQARFKRLRIRTDLDDAVSAHRKAVELASDEDSEEPGWLLNLGMSLHSRFETYREKSDLEDAIEMTRLAVALAPDGYANKPDMLINLGSYLRRRFERYSGELSDIEESIASHRTAVELVPENDPDKVICYGHLAISLMDSFQRFQRLSDLEESVATQRRVVELTPDHHSTKPARLHNLGYFILRQSLHHSLMKSEFDEALQCFMDATAQVLGDPSARLNSMRMCAQVLDEYPEYSSAELLLRSHGRMLSILPELVWFGYSVSRRFAESAAIGKLFHKAVAVALDVGALAQAIEWTEEGRAFVWAQVASLRTPLDELATRHPTLAEKARKMIEELQHSHAGHGASDRPGTVSETMALAVTSKAAEDEHRRRVVKYEQLLGEIRLCPGFEDFLRPRKLAGLLPRPALNDEYIVLVNVHDSRCDALVICPENEVRTIALPELTLDRAEKMRSLFYSNLSGSRQMLQTREASERAVLQHSNNNAYVAEATRLLARMWTWIVCPILESLNLVCPIFIRRPAGVDVVHEQIKPTANERLPHVTWCPTGPLTQLPIHAAGIYDPAKKSAPRVFDLVVSSYIPSLSTLRRCRENLVMKPYSSESILVVSQPATRNQPALPGVVDEVTSLRRIMSNSQIQTNFLDSEQASVASVQAALPQFRWLHLACHGVQDVADPTQSAFALDDGKLTLSALMETMSDDAELAFLSACQTATGDKNIPEESAHLAAGMLAVGLKGVIATMWSIQDVDAPVIVEAYYESLLALRRSDDLGQGMTGAAYALHEAVRRLREKIGEMKFERWLPFVHFGV